MTGCEILMMAGSAIVVLLVYWLVNFIIDPFPIKQIMFDHNYLGKPKMKRPQDFGY